MPSIECGELSYLRQAIRSSKRVGLFAEFSSWYRSFRREGDGVVEAATCALYEWDILDDIVVNDDGSVSLGLKMDN